jgi:protein-S-isoprenylcysteine O-methyltransferase Ste14
MTRLIASDNRVLRRKLYDLLAASPLITLYLFSLSQMFSPLALQISQVRLFMQTSPSLLPPVLVLGIISDICSMVFFSLLVVMFAVRRIPLDQPIDFYPRLVAGAGTFLGIGILTLAPRELSPGLYLVTLFSIIGGTVFAVSATLSLARSISIMPEARGLVTSGLYAVVRHPLYLGEFVVLFGIALQHSMPWALLILAVQCVFQLQRMKNEERVLARAFPDYADYALRTARLVPGVY